MGTAPLQGPAWRPPVPSSPCHGATGPGPCRQPRDTSGVWMSRSQGFWRQLSVAVRRSWEGTRAGTADPN